jgi:hypothetical protein
MSLKSESVGQGSEKKSSNASEDAEGDEPDADSRTVVPEVLLLPLFPEVLEERDPLLSTDSARVRATGLFARVELLELLLLIKRFVNGKIGLNLGIIIPISLNTPPMLSSPDQVSKMSSKTSFDPEDELDSDFLSLPDDELSKGSRSDAVTADWEEGIEVLESSLRLSPLVMVDVLFVVSDRHTSDESLLSMEG